MKSKLRINFNCNCRIDAICEPDIYRPHFNYIYFKNGFAYATDAHILIKAKLSEISSFNDAQIAMLENKCLHYSLFYKLLQFNIVEVVNDGFEAIDENCDFSILFKFSTWKEKTVNDIEFVLKNAEDKHQTSFEYFGLNPELLKRLNGAFGAESKILKVIVKSSTDPILVYKTGNKSVGLIMPAIINE